MARSLPDDFYIHGDGYPKMDGYGELCVQLVETLNSQPKQFWSLTRALDIIREHTAEFYATHRHGAVRAIHQEEYTRVGQWQQDVIYKTLERIHGAALKDIETLTIICDFSLLNGGTGTVPLTQAKFVDHDGKPAFELTHFHSRNEEETLIAEQLWTLCSQMFQAAKTGRSPLVNNNVPLSQAERKRAALECYWYLSHYMPYERGSAGIARIVLEHLAHAVGFTTGRLKPDTDINIEALLRDKDDFVAHFDACFVLPPSYTQAASVNVSRQA